MENGDVETALIDYDYSHLRKYPSFWNTRFPERHPQAKGTREVVLDHDVYAAIAILCLHFKFKESEEEELKPTWEHFADREFEMDMHPNLLDSWSAANVADWIRVNVNKIVQDLTGVEEVQERTSRISQN